MIKATDLQAITEARAQGVDFSKDFYAQGQAGYICADLAKKYKYRKPKHANGSTGRYYFMRLQRITHKQKEQDA